MMTMTREEMNERPHKALRAALQCADGTFTSGARTPEELPQKNSSPSVSRACNLKASGRT